MTNPELRHKELEGLVFAIPARPLTNEHGFVLLPVVAGQKKNALCLVCGTHCRPNAHHAHWPRPARSEQRRLARLHDSRLHGVPDYGKDPLRKLRQAQFAISGPICSLFHRALHNVQLAPKDVDLPDTEIIETSISQLERIQRAGGYVSSLEAMLSQSLPLDRIEREHSKAVALASEIPEDDEVVFPTVGYSCAVGVDIPFKRDVPNFDVTFIRDGVARGVKRLERLLS
jgi:hypothetical protein